MEIPYDDDETLISVLNDVASKRQHLAEMEQLARYGQRYLSEAEQFEAWKAQQKQPAAKAEPESKKPKWQAPEFDRSWMDRVKLDESTGRYVPADMFTSPVLAEKVNAYMQWRNEAGQRLVSNPLEVWREAGGEDLIREQLEAAKQEIRQQIYSEMRQASAKSAADQWIADNSDKFFATSNGQLLNDPQTGEPVLSARGLAFRQYAQEARQVFGLQNEEQIRQYALRQYERDDRAGRFGDSAQPASLAQPSIEDRNEAMKRSTVAKAAAAAVAPAKGQAARQRAGGDVLEEHDDTFSAMPQRSSFLQMALAEAKKNGLALN